ncbi:K02A2.6-like [Cordylochernes scorpioides]|uniref:RNA-directed DNA polymerase n=1 Tax=Cordylochernes scorpioides TaxID=51811 RepID=A0ABY6KXU6_9ARAC|nr:K02A2.6-like [Cordylochernes scorpioides]
MASSTGNSLQPFVPGTNPSEAWGKWKKRFQMFYIATEIDKKSIPRQRAILLYNIGELALDIYSTFKIQETDASPTVPDILELFDGHFKPYKNTTYKRYQFFTTEQGENQNFDDYVTELKNKSMDCEFGELADSLLKPRLERLVLKLMRYDFNLEYVPGKVIHTADTLSRDSISEETIDTSDLDLQNTIMTLNLKVTTKRYQEILRDMESDEEMIKLRDHILNGWPIHKKSVDYAVKPYWHCKEELYIWKDLICRGQRLVIPKVQRESILQTLHMSHQGISACKNRAHEAIYWPGLDREIEEMVYKCRICQESQPSQRKEPLIPHEIADYPWQKVAIDFFYLDQSVFIIIVDYYSSFPEVIKVASTSAKEILPVLKSTFARHGIPEIIITDNGPPFTSQDFTNFTNEWDIEHKTSSPGYPKSNGLVERMVQTVKKQLKKCRQDNTDPYMCLIALRTTPSNNLPSPAQMLMGRNLRTLIPMKTTKLKPAFISTENILQQKRENQYKMKEYYDRNAKILPKMSSGEQVNAKTSNAWRPATIIGEANQPRSYIIQNNEGRMLKRNRVHLRPRSYPVGQRRSSQSSPQLDPAPSTSSESSGQREPGEFPRLNLSPEELAPSTSTPIGNYNEGGTAYTTRSGRVVKPPKRFDPGL